MRKIFMVLLPLGVFIVMGYSAAYAFSPKEDDLNLNVAAVTWVNAGGQKAVQVFFSYKLDGPQILSKKQLVNVRWGKDWKLYSYNLQEKGVYEHHDTIAAPSDYREEMNFALNPQMNYDHNARGQGYVILLPKNKVLSQQAFSSVSARYIYKSWVKEAKISNSTGWENKSFLDKDKLPTVYGIARYSEIPGLP